MLHYIIIELQFSSVAQLCLTFWDPMDCSIPGPSVLHHLPELAQTLMSEMHRYRGMTIHILRRIIPDKVESAGLRHRDGAYLS